MGMCQNFYAPLELVFSAGDLCSQMHCIIRGDLSYTADLPCCFGIVHKRLPGNEEEVSPEEDVEKVCFHETDRVAEKDFVSEVALWTEWDHNGTLTSLKDSTI